MILKRYVFLIAFVLIGCDLSDTTSTTSNADDLTTTDTPPTPKQLSTQAPPTTQVQAPIPIPTTQPTLSHTPMLENVDYVDEALNYEIRIPTSWSVQHRDGISYFDSGGREYFGVSYFINVVEHPNNAPFPETITGDFSDELKISFSYDEITIGEYQAFTTLSMPSQFGAFTTFVNVGDRFLAFSFTPFTDEVEFADTVSYTHLTLPTTPYV